MDVKSFLYRKCKNHSRSKQRTDQRVSVHNWPKPFFFTAQSRPQPRIDISYYKYVPRPICLLICGKNFECHFIKDFAPLCDFTYRIAGAEEIHKKAIAVNTFLKNFTIISNRVLKGCNNTIKGL